MKKIISDTYLAILAFVCCAGAFAAWKCYPSLPKGFRIVVFGTFYLAPAILAYGAWKVVVKQRSPQVVICLLAGLLATSVWACTVLSRLGAR